jgi:hypothetical protein
MMSFTCLRFCEDTPFLAVQLGGSTVWDMFLLLLDWEPSTDIIYVFPREKLKKVMRYPSTHSKSAFIISKRPMEDKQTFDMHGKLSPTTGMTGPSESIRQKAAEGSTLMLCNV